MPAHLSAVCAPPNKNKKPTRRQDSQDHVTLSPRLQQARFHICGSLSSRPTYRSSDSDHVTGVNRAFMIDKCQDHVQLPRKSVQSMTWPSFFNFSGTCTEIQDRDAIFMSGITIVPLETKYFIITYTFHSLSQNAEQTSSRNKHQAPAQKKAPCKSLRRTARVDFLARSLNVGRRMRPTMRFSLCMGALPLHAVWVGAAGRVRRTTASP